MEGLSNGVTQKHRQKRYGRSSSSHFALHVKVPATAMDRAHARETPEKSIDSVPNIPISGGPKAHEYSDDDGVEDAEDEGRSLDGSPELTSSMWRSLPDRPVAMRLVSRYFEAIQPIWPFVIESEVRDLFTSTWTSEDKSNSIKLVQLSLVIGLAALQHEAQRAKGAKLCGQAKKYLHGNAFEAISIELLQVMLLLALYEFRTLRLKDLYLTVGHAARIAQRLSVHISRPEVDSVSPLQRELRRRLWWGCFCLGRIASILCGRPIGIPYGEFAEYQDTLPQPADEEYIALGLGQPSEKPATNAFFPIPFVSIMS